MCVGSLAGVTYLHYTVLMGFTKSETAVHCCDPALSVLVILVSQNVCHLVSAFQFIVCLYIFVFGLIRSLVDPMLAAFTVCGPLQSFSFSFMYFWAVGVILQFMCVGFLAGVTNPRYTVLTSSNKSETAVHCCDPALSVLVMLVSRNVFHVVSALPSFAFIHILFWLIRSLVDPTLAVFIVCGPLHLVTHIKSH